MVHEALGFSKKKAFLPSFSIQAKGPFDEVLGKMRDLPTLKAELASKGTLNMTFWFCAVSVNQHDNICGSFVPPSPGESEEERLDREGKEHDRVLVKRNCNVPSDFTKLPLCHCTTSAE